MITQYVLTQAYTALVGIHLLYVSRGHLCFGDVDVGLIMCACDKVTRHSEITDFLP